MPQYGPAVPLWTFCALALTFTVKHFIADFLLQTNWIAHGKERREGWFVPLLVHVLCHATLTLAIAFALAPRLWWLAPVDFVVHGTIDRCKSLVGQMGCRDMTRVGFWWLMGFDQLLHQITNIAMAATFFVF